MNRVIFDGNGLNPLFGIFGLKYPITLKFFQNESNEAEIEELRKIFYSEQNQYMSFRMKNKLKRIEEILK